ncbi:hypothetical protein PHSY_007333 [Pseudozyma hubeiensis SY62]|uniref:Uncharacterized protein n=1 Tax=Pseudozyma hubeiensis (strain SY62) TaxID=1305764 RepID=R9PNM0_PSEHS|nr:hypothetical protein PHSY_007333 [Pseudozyma hubeiensis SY62]GAC99730.1 hypothetical protein PHSY_007333 [Pseudozyma hubeiensis SY62]
MALERHAFLDHRRSFKPFPSIRDLYASKGSMIILSVLILFSIGSTAGANTPRSSPAVPPPAGRSLLSRSSYLEPYDYPTAVQADFDTRAHVHPYYPTLGPPEFWTEPSLRKHYSSTLHLRYHPSLFPAPPPFEVWFKEQQLIRAINMLSQTIDLETEHRQLDRLALFRREMQLGELSILLRLTQIATTLRYAALAPEWRWFEESMYRQWAAFLQISQNAAKDEKGKGSNADWENHLQFLQQVRKAQEEEEEEESEEENEIAGQIALRDATLKGKKKLDEQSGWKEVPIEREDLASSTPRRWIHTPNLAGSASDREEGKLGPDLKSSTPRRWEAFPGAAQGSGEHLAEGLEDIPETVPSPRLRALHSRVPIAEWWQSYSRTHTHKQLPSVPVVYRTPLVELQDRFTSFQERVSRLARLKHKTKFFRPFSLGGFGIEGRQTDRPLAGAFRIYTPPAQAVTTLHIAVDKAPDPGTSRTLVSPKAGTKPRVKKTTRLWIKLESNDKPVDVSTSGPSTSGSVVLKAAPIVNQDLEVPKQPTDHVKPSLTPWSYYRSNYFKQSPPKLFFRNVLMSQASLRIQARIEALQAAKTASSMGIAGMKSTYSGPLDCLPRYPDYGAIKRFGPISSVSLFANFVFSSTRANWHRCYGLAESPIVFGFAHGRPRIFG